MLTLLPVFSMTPTERNLSHAGTSSVTRMVVSLRICLLPHSPPALRSQVNARSVALIRHPCRNLLGGMLLFRQTHTCASMARPLWPRVCQREGTIARTANSESE